MQMGVTCQFLQTWILIIFTWQIHHILQLIGYSGKTMSALCPSESVKSLKQIHKQII